MDSLDWLSEFTKAANYNHETVVKITELHETWRPKSPLLEQYKAHFSELYAQSKSIREYRSEAASSSTRNREPPTLPPAPPPSELPKEERRNRVEWGERTDPPTTKAAPPVPPDRRVGTEASSSAAPLVINGHTIVTRPPRAAANRPRAEADHRPERTEDPELRDPQLSRALDIATQRTF